MKQTAVEWLEKIRHGQKGQPFDDYEWEIAFNHAKEMEKENLESLKDFDTWKKKLNNEEEDTDSSIDLGVIDEEV